MYVDKAFGEQMYNCHLKTKDVSLWDLRRTKGKTNRKCISDIYQVCTDMLLSSFCCFSGYVDMTCV